MNKSDTFFIIYIFIQKNNNTFPYILPFHLLLISCKTTVEFFMETVQPTAHASVYMRNLLQNFMFNHALCGFLFSYWKYMMRRWHFSFSGWYLISRDEPFCKQGNMQPVVTTSCLLILKQPKQKSCVF